MGKCLRIGSFILGASLVFGCASQNAGLVAKNGHDLKTLAADETYEHDPVSGKMLVKKAKSAIGTPYVMGGSKPGGFDCSGLVQWTYNSLGVTLPRTAREQASVGRKVHDVKDMRAGDIVAFRHPKRGYHTGIYVGDGKFVHSPRKRSSVRINSLSDPYFRSILLGARRINLNGSENLLASASGNLEKMVEEKSRLALSARNIEKIKSASSRHAAKATAAKKAEPRNAKVALAKKKSTIAEQARKIQSVKTVTGKSKTSSKNLGAHTNLAKASKKASSKIEANNTKKSKVNAVSTKAASKIMARNSKTSAAKVAANSKKSHGKTVSMLTKKQSQSARRRN